MLKRLVAVAAVGVSLGFGVALLAPQPALADSCCKHCHKGKACGNSCIPKSEECHLPKGCACDA